MKILDILYQILSSPLEAFSELGMRKPWKEALLTAIFIAMIMAFTILPNPPDLINAIFGLKKGELNIVLAVFFWIAFFLAVILAQGIALHFTAGLLGGQGSYVGIVSSLCFAFFPLVFFAPLALIRAHMESATGNALYPIGSLVLFLWVLLLIFVAVYKNYRFSIAKSLATYFIPTILLVLIPLLLLITFTAL